MQKQFSSLSADLGTAVPETCYLFPGLELYLTSPLYWCHVVYPAAGFVRLVSADAALEGYSVRIRSLVTGLAEEAFLDKTGAFTQEVELQPEMDNALEFTVCDGAGREIGHAVVGVQHRSTQSGSGRIRKANNSILPSPLNPAEDSRKAILDPPWPRFVQLVQRCLHLATEVADKTGRDPAELCEPICTQERYAEQAYEQRNQTLYYECKDNLEKYRNYLAQLLGETLPFPPRSRCPSEADARAAVDHFRASLSAVWKQVRKKQRADLEMRLSAIAVQARGLSQRVKNEPLSAFHEAEQLATEVAKVADLLHQ